MSTTPDRPAWPGASGGDWWSRRPRRSSTDRKVAGVAGGLGRTFGVDPVLIRVAFVVLTIFGAAGLTLYLLGWLLLPADTDEVSPAEALLGRGRSATSPLLTVGLAIVAGISILSMFSWGLPFWPLVVIGVVVVLLARKKGRSCPTNRTPEWVDQFSSKFSEAGRQWGDQAEQWVARQPWSGQGQQQQQQQDRQRSPFDRPAFWDGTAAEPTNGPATADRVNLRKDDARPDATPTAKAAPAEAPAAPQPPAWDPLGVAPFAWDLPEPAAPPPPPVRRDRGVVGRITMGLVLLVGGLAVLGIFQGWWALSWAGVSAVALTIVAVGLLISSLRGRGRSLIGPGIFLSLLTLALTITGIDGTSGYGQQTWTPTTVAAANSEFVLNGGQATLDLRQLDLTAGQTVNPEVTVRAGQATVIVPDDANVNVTCTANAGEVNCLGVQDEGLRTEIVTSQDGSSDEGTINVTLHVGAGQGTVRHG